MEISAAQKRMILIICSISAFVTPFMGASITIAMPPIGKEFNMDAILLAWVATIYNVSAAIFLLPLGKFADLKGREKIFKFGMALFTVTSLACAVSWDSYTLLTFRFLQGIGGAMIFGTSNAILSAAYPKKKRGGTLGVYITILYLGMTLGPVLGGFMTNYFGWRSIFWFSAVLSLVNTVLAFARMPNLPVEGKGSLDLPGSVMCGVALVLLMIGFSKLPAALGGLLVAGGVVGFLLFGIIETRVASPVLDIRVFRGNYPFIFSNIAELITMAATFAIGFLLSLYLQYILGLTAGQTALVLAIKSGFLIVFSRYAGKLSDKVEPAKIASLGLALAAIGLFAYIFIGVNTSIWFICIFMVFIGMGLAFFTSPITNLVMSSVDKKDFGVASATISIMRQLGMNLSMGIMMMLFSIYNLKGRSIKPEVYGNFLMSSRIGFTIFTVLCVLAIFALIARGKLKPKAEDAGEEHA